MPATANKSKTVKSKKSQNVAQANVANKAQSKTQSKAQSKTLQDTAKKLEEALANNSELAVAALADVEQKVVQAAESGGELVKINEQVANDFRENIAKTTAVAKEVAEKVAEKTTEQARKAAKKARKTVKKKTEEAVKEIDKNLAESAKIASRNLGKSSEILQEASKQFIARANENFNQNIAAASELVAAKNINEFFEIQRRVVRQNFENAVGQCLEFSKLCTDCAVDAIGQAKDGLEKANK